jgi:predicted ribosome quality control (RQC) complex YloA/Tae2 family protein
VPIALTLLSRDARYRSAVQPVDFTTATAACAELRRDWLPARLEQAYQRDRTHLFLALRTLAGRGWLTVSWHPQAARLCLSDPPPKAPDTFTFSDQLRHQLMGLALVKMEAIAPWERVIDLQFARRPDDSVLWHLYVEIMGKYSNAILVNRHNEIVTAAHQVTPKQSRIRPILTGTSYEPPPGLTETAPDPDESRQRWQDRIALVPGPLRRNILKNYRGLSSALIISMAQAAGIDPECPTDRLDEGDWQRLFERWQDWLHALDREAFQPGWTENGYTVMGWGIVEPADSVQVLLDRYYRDRLNRQEFKQLRHQLAQKVKSAIAKAYQKLDGFVERLHQSDRADEYRQKADLLMAYQYEWKPGMSSIALPDFETGEAVEIPLDRDKNAIQNAQVLYKRHQKLKRARAAIEPLIEEVKGEIDYLEQVDAACDRFDDYRKPGDLRALEEIRDELIAQGYLKSSQHRSRSSNEDSDFDRYATPSGFELLVGRNNRQNDRLTFRVAGDYDLWFHTQEIPGSHVLLRLQPGAVPDEADLQFAADVAAYYSRASQGDRAPVVYTEPKHVYKPKGAKPGMAIYKQERILWGEPGRMRRKES